ncbi:hypothetical protein [Rhodoferax sp.]|uniref:hypothetical protein n=1 Tax=Rhodoferax sp. TaxID=50421 RepID=UPI00262BBA34|nr:hypothetical protein [Rhodoferax sp.]MDD2808230.1 hypothetical protein [Rhodoferax sp.]MDD4941977.1 hypothetical protein [Rhodoferax sp.]
MDEKSNQIKSNQIKSNQIKSNQIKSNYDIINIFVYLIAVIAASWYIFHPNFIARTLVYFLIWWAGVELANRYIVGDLSLKNIYPLLVALSCTVLILGVGVYLDHRAGRTASLGVHPILEFRHFAFALVVILGALIWQRIAWFGFDSIFKPFLLLAPISYSLYISHQYLVVQATYLSWLKLPAVEWVAYFTVAIMFCNVLEVRIYPLCRDWIFNISDQKSGG